MTIGLIDVDGHNFPNLALMKLAAYHKQQGDTVDWYQQDHHYDLVYQSKVFDETYTPDITFTPQADTVIKGGTGYGLENKLPEPVEHIMPDYGLYNIQGIGGTSCRLRKYLWKSCGQQRITHEKNCSPEMRSMKS